MRKGSKIWRGLGLALVLGLAALGAALHFSWLRIPANWAPWGEVVLDQPPSWFARMQVNSLSADPAACIAALDRSQLSYRPVESRASGTGCGLHNAVRPVQSHIPYSRSFNAACALMAALYWYEARLQHLAQAQLRTTIARIDHLGTYACRNVNSAAEGRRSQHATANAIDIAGFSLADGRVISVQEDWGKPTPEGGFLAAAHDEACGLFNVVLGPDYNARHANHFHLDLGPYRMCR